MISDYFRFPMFFSTFQKCITMKIIVFLIFFLGVTTIGTAQILNNSFENNNDPDLSHWEWTCNTESYEKAPQGGGKWCIQVPSGNTQGCYPGFVYQKVPWISTDKMYTLSAWVYADSPPVVGINFGKINNGNITLLEGDTTTSASWTRLQVTSDFSLLTGDTAIVILNGGLIGGPVQGYGFFDLIQLEEISKTKNTTDHPEFQLYQNPCVFQSTIILEEKYTSNVDITVTNIYGQVVLSLHNISGSEVTLDREQLPAGLYGIHLKVNDKLINTKKWIISE
jgi:hypothetical protein